MERVPMTILYYFSKYKACFVVTCWFTGLMGDTWHRQGSDCCDHSDTTPWRLLCPAVPQHSPKHHVGYQEQIPALATSPSLRLWRQLQEERKDLKLLPQVLECLQPWHLHKLSQTHCQRGASREHCWRDAALKPSRGKKFNKVEEKNSRKIRVK